MILHAAIHWPEEVSIELWPMAMDYAVFVYNRLPQRDCGLAPIELFTGTRLDKKVLRSAHVWGCPTYVLDVKIQDGKKLPRWQPKSRRGQFLGFSKRHASTIGLIKNVQTGSISPQFHVVFDDNFTTIPSRVNDDAIEPPANWNELLLRSRMNLLDPEEDRIPKLNDEWLSAEERRDKERKQQQRGRNPARLVVLREDPEQQLPEQDEDGGAVPILQDDDDDDDEEEQNDYWQPRNEKRVRVPNRRYFGDDFQSLTNLNQDVGYAAMINDFGLLTEEEAFIANLGADESFRPKHVNSQLEQMEVIESLQLDEDGLLSSLHPLAFAAELSPSDERTRC